MRVLLATGEHRGRKDQKTRPLDICQTGLPPKNIFSITEQFPAYHRRPTETGRWFHKRCQDCRREGSSGQQLFGGEKEKTSPQSQNMIRIFIFEKKNLWNLERGEEKGNPDKLHTIKNNNVELQ